jgi:hypothetical protein
MTNMCFTVMITSKLVAMKMAANVLSLRIGLLIKAWHKGYS